MSITTPFHHRQAISGGPSLDARTRQATVDLSRQMDNNEVWVRPGTDLERACNTRGVQVVRLYAGEVYRYETLTLERPIQIIGHRSTILEGVPNYVGPLLTINSSTGIVELRGVTVKTPIVVNSRSRLLDIALDTLSVTALNSAKIEVDGAAAAGSAVLGCEGLQATGVGDVGIWVGNNAADCRILGNDFSNCAEAIHTWAALSTMYGPEANPGVVTVI